MPDRIWKDGTLFEGTTVLGAVTQSGPERFMGSIRNHDEARTGMWRFAQWFKTEGDAQTYVEGVVDGLVQPRKSDDGVIWFYRPPNDLKHCAFCGKNEHEAAIMLGGVNVFICDECVDHSAKLVAAKRAQTFRKDKTCDEA